MKYFAKEHPDVIVLTIILILALFLFYSGAKHRSLTKPEIDTNTFITNHSEITDSTLNNK